MGRITQIPQSDAPGDRLLSLSKHALLALLTGGMSLIWLVGRKLPSWWESACLERARWIENGRRPDAWKWLQEGWKATGGTILVSVPVAMAMTAGGSMLIRSLAGKSPSAAAGKTYVFLIVSPPVLACAIALTLVATWLWHSGRQAASLAWAHRPWSN